MATMPNNRLLMIVAIASGALLIGMILPSTAIFNSGTTAAKTTVERLVPQGYVVVSAIRNGQEFYHAESHNLIVNQGFDFIANQTGFAPQTTNKAQWIGLSANTVVLGSSNVTLAGELSTSGLTRASGSNGGVGTITHPAQNQYVVTKTFTAGAAQTGIKAAGLFTTVSGNSLFAENNFPSVDLQNSDQLTITWTITFSSQ